MRNNNTMELYKLIILLACCVCMMMAGLAGALDQQSQEFLDSHNGVRKAVGNPPVPPLVWDEKVAAYAQQYASQRSGDCQLIHSGGPYGENIYMGYGAGYADPAAAVQLWADEKPYYDYGSNSCSVNECRHYTQIVWRDSKRLGCASVTCGSGNTFITCNYDPPGNWNGQRPY